MQRSYSREQVANGPGSGVSQGRSPIFSGSSSDLDRQPAVAGLLDQEGAVMTAPRDLIQLVSVDVQEQVATAVAALEQHGPVVTAALQQLDQANTAAWNAVRPAEPTDDEWRLVQHATGISRGWGAAYRLVSTLDPPGQGRRAD